MEPVQEREHLSELLERCLSLCGETEQQLDHLANSQLGFLSSGVADALQQLELILRIASDEREDSPQRQARQGLLKRLFQRGGDDQEPVEDYQPPSFDVSKMGLHGNTSTIPIPELLGFLAFGAKTGVLWVDSPEENFLVGLVDGQLRHANSDQTPPGLRLGEVLVSLGYLTQRQLERYLVRNEETGEIEAVTGEALLEAGIISDDELAAALTYQTRSLFQRLIATRNAVFRFREGMQVALAHQVALDINQLLLDHARVQDEAAYYSSLNEAVPDENPEEIDELLTQALSETVIIVDDEDEAWNEESGQPKAEESDGDSGDESDDETGDSERAEADEDAEKAA